jgi:D-ribose pyranose/furanose isomerase RbsD
MKLLLIVSCVFAFCFFSCKSHTKEIGTENWKTKFEAELPLLGHRNWIIIADKAFPQQNSAGIEIIYTDQNLASVLKYVDSAVAKNNHITPIIYKDKEFDFLKEDQAVGVTALKNEVTKILDGKPTQTLLHDSVFTKLDQSAKLFKVLVLKTNETIPYSSLFMQLDCKYWNADKEVELRKEMSSSTQK